MCLRINNIHLLISIFPSFETHLHSITRRELRRPATAFGYISSDVDPLSVQHGGTHTHTASQFGVGSAPRSQVDKDLLGTSSEHSLMPRGVYMCVCARVCGVCVRVCVCKCAHVCGVCACVCVCVCCSTPHCISMQGARCPGGVLAVGREAEALQRNQSPDFFHETPNNCSSTFVRFRRSNLDSSVPEYVHCTCTIVYIHVHVWYGMVPYAHVLYANHNQLHVYVHVHVHVSSGMCVYMLLDCR